jgi:peptide deformylase
MAIRTIREIGDPVLTKKCKEVAEMTPRLSELIDDMLETMYDANGVGLAASQVGVLKNIVVMDVSSDRSAPLVLVNPRIIESSGEQTGTEGCLSVPGKLGVVTRANYVKVAAFDRDMKPFEAEGTELFARCVCHELDHLVGRMYVELVQGDLMDVEPADGEESTGNEEAEAAPAVQTASGENAEAAGQGETGR